MNPNVRVPFVFQPTPVIRLTFTRQLLRDKLAEVRDMLLTHQINGGGRQLRMESFCDPVRDEHGNKCGTAACIGGWMSVLLTGREDAALPVMRGLVALDMQMRGFMTDEEEGPLFELFYSFSDTKNFNEPRVAATAIQRYLSGKKHPWPSGVMPDKLRYKQDRKGH